MFGSTEGSQNNPQDPSIRPGSAFAPEFLIRHLPIAAYTCDAEGLITGYNEVAQGIWGRAPKLHDPEHRYCGSFRLYSADGRPIDHDQCWMALALQSGKEFTGQEIRIERPQGDFRIVLAHAVPFHSDSGELLGAINYLVDITQQKQAEESLLEKERKYREVIETTSPATGTNFFRTLVQRLASAAGVDIAFIARLEPTDPSTATTLAAVACGKLIENFSYKVEGNPCGPVIENQLPQVSQGVGEQFSKRTLFPKWDIHSYMAVPLFGSTGNPLGLIALLHQEDIPHPDHAKTLLSLAAVRTGTEIERATALEALRRKTHFIETITEASPHAMYVFDLVDRRPIWTNNKIFDELGYSLEQLQRMGEDLYSAVLHPDDLARMSSLLARWNTAADDDILETHFRMKSAAGTWRWFEAHNAVFTRDPDGTVRQIIGITQDVTERKHSEEALREREARYTGLFQAIPSAVFVCDNDAIIQEYNSRAAELWQREPIRGDPNEINCGAVALYDLSGRLIPRSKSPVTEVLETEVATEKLKIWMERPDQSRILVEANFAPLLGSNGEMLGVIASFEDVTEVEQFQRRVQESEERYRSVVELCPEPIAIIQDGKVMYVNTAGAQVVGFDSPSELIGQSLLKLLHPDDVGKSRERLARVFETGQSVPLEQFRVQHRDGQWRVLESRAGPCHFQGAEAIQVVVRNITERIATEHSLRRIGAFRETIIRTAAEGICVCFPIPTFPFLAFTIWNDRMTEITGYTIEEINQLGWYQALYDDPQVRKLAAVRISKMHEGEDLLAEEWEIRRKDGQRRTLSISTSAVEMERIPNRSPNPADSPSTGESDADTFTPTGMRGVVALMQDVTERKQAEHEQRKLEEQMRHAQKLESLGILAGGIAHDFNNLLTSILGYSELAELELPADALQVSPFLKEIKNATLHAAELTKQMLAYSGRGKFDIQIISLDTIVRDLAQLLLAVVSKKSTFELALEPALIEADVSQIRQVVMNLITNASEALDGKEGVIRIATGITEMDTKTLWSPFLQTDLPAGQYAYLQVADTGCGMSQEVLAKVFDPFFTTKFTGRGLGLAAVLGIVRGHKGTLHIDSEVGKGTTFRIYLPSLEEPDQQLTSQTSSPRDVPVAKGKILVVDDEHSIRSLLTRMLTRAGYDVLPTCDGAEALEVIAQQGNQISGILLDLTMPRIDGWEVAETLSTRGVRIPILMMSGYAQLEVPAACSGAAIEGFLQKPFQPQDVLNRVLKMTGKHP